MGVGVVELVTDDGWQQTRLDDDLAYWRRGDYQIWPDVEFVGYDVYHRGRKFGHAGPMRCSAEQLADDHAVGVLRPDFAQAARLPRRQRI